MNDFSAETALTVWSDGDEWRRPDPSRFGDGCRRRWRAAAAAAAATQSALEMTEK